MPEPISRYVSELYLDRASPHLADGEWHVWRALMTCDDTTLFGFFRPRLFSLAANARSNLTTATSMLVKLDDAHVIVFDREWVWLPGYFEVQVGTRVPNWVKIVKNAAARFEGDTANRAYAAFCERFANILDDAEEPKKSETEQPADPKKKKPRPAQQTVTAPAFEEVLSFVRSVRTAAGRKHPAPKAKAETIYDWIDKKSRMGWTDDWQDLVRKFVVEDIGDELGEDEEDTAMEEVRLAI